MSKGPEPAFPLQRELQGSDGNYIYSPNGISLRQYYAAKAMQGDWAAQRDYADYFVNDCKEEILTLRAKLYLRMADALLSVEENE